MAMAYLIFSDIHGSEDSTKRMAALFNGGSYEGILLLGDLLYHGPRNDLPDGYAPKKVIQILNSLADKIVAVRGNCDAEVDQMVLTFPIMETYRTVDLDGRRFIMTHGHVYNEEKAPPGGMAVLYGHTHIPVLHEVSGRLFYNPGSATIPKGGFPRSYGVFDEGKLKIINLLDGSVMFSE